MHILYIAYFDMSVAYAPSIHLTELCKHIVNMGQCVTILAVKPKRPIDSPLLEKCQVIYVPHLRLRILGTVVFSIVASVRLLYEILSSRIDVIYERDSVFGILACQIARFMNKPLIIEINGLPRGNFIRRMIGSLSIRLHKHVAAFICTAQGYKSFMVREFGIPPSKIFVLPMGVNEESFYPLKRELCIRKLGLNASRRYIGYVGSFQPHHDMDTLICAMRLVVSKLEDVELILVGNGSSLPECQRLVAGNGLQRRVRFVGAVPASVVPQYLSVFDIAVQSLKKEVVEVQGMGTSKVPEYLACACSLVATDIPGTETFDTFKQFVYVVPPENPKAMSDAFIHLLSDPDLREQLGSRGRQYVLSYRTWRSVAKRTIEIADNVLRQPNQARAK